MALRWLGELRAGKLRAFRLIWIPALIVPLILLTPRFLTHCTPSKAPVPASLPAAPSDSLASGGITLKDTVRRGDTFTGLLLRNRLSVQEIGRILDLNARLRLFSPRSLHPGQELTLTRDDFGRLAEMTLKLSPEETYVFETEGDSLTAHLIPVNVETRLRKFEGEVETTFDDAIRAAGGDYKLTLKVADLFAYDVDFLTEVRRGDRFSILAEERFVDGQPLGFGDVLYATYQGDKARSAGVYYSGAGSRHGDYYDLQGRAQRKAFLRSPLNYRKITSYFSESRFHPILKVWRPHHGVDYAAATGTPVVAVANGAVEFAGWSGGYGRMIRLRHEGRMETIYGHLSRFAEGLVSGGRVSQGQVIGYVGQTGLATGPHLHYEVVEGGVSVNPLGLKNVPAEPVPPSEMVRFQEYAGRLQDLDRSMLAGQVLDSFDRNQIQATLAALQSGAETPALR